MLYKKLRYPDGGIYAQIESFEGKTIIERINSYEDLFFIKSLKDICDYNGIKDVELVIPCMFQQQHDRRFNKNESFELKLVADFINTCNFSKVHIFHPHSDSTEMAINNFHLIDNSYFISEVIKDINDSNPPIILSTDAGSFKWINKLADKIDYQGEVYGANKSRDQQTHKLKQIIDRQDFEGKDVLVLDDLCVGGGTFIGLANMLKERNVGNLYLAVSHITIENPRKELESLYTKIWSTNSKYENYNLNNIKIIKQF